jgi:hypothetical protein
MYITEGKSYDVILCPESSTVQVQNPDEGYDDDGGAVTIKPVRYLRSRFRLID